MAQFTPKVTQRQISDDLEQVVKEDLVVQDLEANRAGKQDEFGFDDEGDMAVEDDEEIGVGGKRQIINQF